MRIPSLKYKCGKPDSPGSPPTSWPSLRLAHSRCLAAAGSKNGPDILSFEPGLWQQPGLTFSASSAPSCLWDLGKSVSALIASVSSSRKWACFEEEMN